MTLQEVVTQAVVAQPNHSHAVIAVWVLSGVVATLLALLWAIMRARGGWEYITTIPFTNLRQLVSLALAVTSFVGVGSIGYLAGVWPPENIWDSALIALTAWMSIDVAQFAIKRITTRNDMPTRQNVQTGQFPVAISPPAAPVPGQPAVPANEVPVVPAQPQQPASRLEPSD